MKNKRKLTKNRAWKKTLLMIGKASLMCLAFLICFSVTVSADTAETDAATLAIENLRDFLFGIIRAVGVILAAWGVVQIGMSINSHDASQRANGFFSLAGGLLITFVKEILQLIGVL